MKYYWGIDPGLSGWLAIADSESEHVHLYPLCNFDATFWHIRDQQEICPPDKIVLEEIPPALGKFRRGSKANQDRKSTRLNSSHSQQSRMPSSA